MSLINTVNPKTATGPIKQIYDGIKKQMGMIPNAFIAFSASPHRLEAQVKEIGYYMGHPNLGQELTAAIRYTVAAEHDCEYCVVVNGGMLQQAGWSKDNVEALVTDPGSANLNAKDKALFLTVLKAIRTPAEVDQGDIEELRSLGWSDQDIFDGVAHGAYSIAFDTMISAFKIQPEKH